MHKKVLNVLACLALASSLLGCGDGLKHFPTAAVSGQVLCEGQPVPYAQVYFEPLAQGDSAVSGKPGFAIADEAGKFTIGTYEADDGAVIGKHRVRVDPPVPGKNPPDWSCNCEMNSNVDVMQVDIVDGENQFDVVLKKAKGGRKTQMSEEDLEELREEEEEDG